VTRYETGAVEPPPSMLVALAAVLDVDVSVFFAELDR
jgi:hypothetical protein